MNSNKTALMYSILAILTLSVIVFLFLFLSAGCDRGNFFYFQLGYALFCAVLFWGWMLFSLRAKTHQSGTRVSMTGGAVIAYVVISAIVMGIYSGIINNPPKLAHTYYYSTVTVLTFLFILVTSLGNIFASRDETITAELERPRNDLKAIAANIEDSRKDAGRIIESSSADIKRKLENEFRTTIEILKRKVPDKSKMAYIDKIRQESDRLSSVIKSGSENAASDVLSMLENIRDYAGRL
jgi:cation transport ATPase